MPENIVYVLNLNSTMRKEPNSITGHLNTCKINAILDGESNKEELDLKRSIADLVVEDAEGNKYIVEIERSYTPNFMHKACFNSSRIVVDGIYGSQDYTTIKKVFHISLLYFSTKEMQKPIYHGKTIIHEIDTQHPVDVKIANEGMVIFNTPNIFPEYFFISVPMFDDVINAEIDESSPDQWIGP